uniref:Uncharacterized protein n=1 Tax=Candidatus Kentrum sp. LFY TaxID=2126342 RepID=A0A450WR70_9GAMM|nr:MAG: hypothetical protein BECKLFY1418C_GA0070996_105915 [Candidatus Kentron sp. LFY]
MITRGLFGLARRIERKVNEETELYSISEMLQLDRVRPEKDYSGKTMVELDNT